MKIQSIPPRFHIFILLFVGVFCVLATSYAVFHSGFFRPHDFTHAARIVEMNRSLQQGEFPVRWSQNFGFGFGMPLFNFYAPLPYYVAQIPYVLTQNAIFSIKFLYVLNAALAFIGMYLFGRSLWGKKGGLISAVAFSFSTYRAVDLYVRGALGEATAMVLLPFTLFGIHRLKTHRLQGILFISLSLAATLLSHNLIGMISVAVVAVYGCLTVGRKKLVALFLALSLAIALSAFYVLPAFFEKDFTRVESTITTGYFDFHNHFVALRQFITGTWGYGGSQPGLEDGMSFALGYVPILLCGVSVLGLVVLRKKYKNISLLLFFLAGSLFMASAKSVFIWENIHTLKYMQFPWRFLTFSHVFLSAVAGGAILLVQKYMNMKGKLIFISITLFSFVFLQAQFFQPEEYISDTDQYYRTDPAFISTVLSDTLNDYLPREQIENPAFARSEPRLFRTAATDVKVDNLWDFGHRVKADIECQQYCLVSVNIFQFPGWTVTVDGKRENLLEDPTFRTYSFRADPGKHSVELLLTDTPIRKIGNGLSIIALAVILWIVRSLYVKRTITI